MPARRSRPSGLVTLNNHRENSTQTDVRTSWFPRNVNVTKRFDFFGATDDSWIGKLWPRGRAWTNSLSRATLADNFCDRWSGGLNFLRHRYSGSEVPIEPTGDVYPCCIKTRRRSATLSTSRSSKASIGWSGSPRSKRFRQVIPSAWASPTAGASRISSRVADTHAGRQALCQSRHRLRRVSRGDARAGDRSRAPSRCPYRSGISEGLDENVAAAPFPGAGKVLGSAACAQGRGVNSDR